MTYTPADKKTVIAEVVRAASDVRTKPAAPVAELVEHEQPYAGLDVDQPSIFEGDEDREAVESAEPVVELTTVTQAIRFNVPTEVDEDQAGEEAAPVEEVRSSTVVRAIEEAWAEIQRRHEELPSVFVTIGSGSKPGKNARLTLGHFAALRWQVGETRLHELFVGGEGLQRGADEVMTTLLHEAAHNIAHARGVEDTSRQGRYHNAKFKTLAIELGLEPSCDKTLGWSPCKLREETRAEYADAIDRLADALRIYRHKEVSGSGEKKSTNLAVASCRCGTKIRLSKKAFDAAPITCGECEQAFALVETDEEG